MQTPYYESWWHGNPKHFQCYVEEYTDYWAHFHYYPEIVYLIEGELYMSINDSVHILRPGEMGFALSNDIHSYKRLGYSKIILLMFSPELIPAFLPPSQCVQYKFDTPFLSAEQAARGPAQWMKLMLNECAKHKQNFMMLKGYLYLLFGQVSEMMKLTLKNNDSEYENSHIHRILDYIWKNYTSDIHLGDLSKAIGLSNNSLSRIFHEKFTCGFCYYVNRLRINLAKQKLLDTDQPIGTIALDCGFENQRHFNRVFKEHTGQTPSQFRQNETSARPSETLIHKNN